MLKWIFYIKKLEVAKCFLSSILILGQKNFYFLRPTLKKIYNQTDSNIYIHMHIVQGSVTVS